MKRKPNIARFLPHTLVSVALVCVGAGAQAGSIDPSTGQVVALPPAHISEVTLESTAEGKIIANHNGKRYELVELADATAGRLAARLAGFYELSNRLSLLPDKGTQFLADFANASDDVIEQLGKQPELVDAWEVLYKAGVDDAVRINTKDLKNIDNLLKDELSQKIKTLDDDGYVIGNLNKESLIDFLQSGTKYEEDISILLEYMLPNNPKATFVVGGVEDFRGLIYRCIFGFNEFERISGRLSEGISAPRWANAEKYVSILDGSNSGTVYKAGIDLMRSNLIKKPNIAFGLRSNNLSNFANSKWAWCYLDDFEKVGISTGGGGVGFVDEFVQAIVNIRSNGGKIFFNLEGVDPLKIKLLDTPNTISGENFTNFEIRNICRNKDWFNNTERFVGNRKLSLQELLNEFGIKPLFE